MIQNKLFNGDCLHILQHINESSIDLVYLDPPFFTQKNHNLKTRDNLTEYSFSDKWNSIKKYEDFMRSRIQKCHDVLKETGSIFLHCDKSASYNLRFILDDIFLPKNFRSEIIWTYKRWSNTNKGLMNAHQSIFFYSKTKKFKFNKIFTNYSPTTNIDQTFQLRTRNTENKCVYKTSNGKLELQKFKKGVPLSDVWDIPYLNPKANERVGYPTQKPILLLDQIINLVTDINDIVLDPFCGSGTTLVSAKLLNRKYIGIDVLKEAIVLAQTRLKKPIKTKSNLLNKGKQAYFNQSKNIAKKLKSLNIAPVQRNSGIDGFIMEDGKIKPIPVRIQRDDENIEYTFRVIKKACKSNGYKDMIVIPKNIKL